MVLCLGFLLEGNLVNTTSIINSIIIAIETLETEDSLSPTTFVFSLTLVSVRKMFFNINQNISISNIYNFLYLFLIKINLYNINHHFF